MIPSERAAQRRVMIGVFLLLLAATLGWSFGRLTGLVPDVDPGRAAQMVVLSYGEEGTPRSLVPNTIRRDIARGLDDSGGFMVVPDASQAIGVKAMGLGRLDDGEYPYTSSFGLQYRLARPFYPLGAWPAYLALTLSVIGASCVLLALLCRWAGGLAGPAGALALGLYFAASPLFLDKIASPYWMLPLFLLPTLIAVIGWPRARSSRTGWALFFTAEALAVTAKCLAGYEFLAPLVAAPALVIMVDELRRQPGRIVPTLLARWLPAAAAMLLAGVLGFALAIALHAWQGDALLPGRGLDAVLVPASYSVTGDGAGVRVHSGGAGEWIVGVVKSFGLRNVHLNLALWGALLWASVSLVRRKGSASAAWAALGPAGQALAVTLPFALMALLSWHVLAMNHALDHNHIVWFLVQIVLAPIAVPLATIAWQARR